MGRQIQVGYPDGSVNAILIYQSIGARLPRQGRLAPVHRAIYDAARNRHLCDALRRYDNLATHIFCMFSSACSSTVCPLSPLMWTNTVPLLRAIAGDGEKATHLAHEHVTGFEAAVRTII